MAVTPTQKNAVITVFRASVEQLDRSLAELARIQTLVIDLGISTITDNDLLGDNAGLAAADIVTAYTNIAALLTEDTLARRASRHKIGHGTL